MFSISVLEDLLTDIDVSREMLPLVATETLAHSSVILRSIFLKVCASGKQLGIVEITAFDYNLLQTLNPADHFE